ncbi:MAG: hypothetical protein H8E66_19895 [Planctomycetes bacterium]|nr:hypothetical protein [Planctomycetota bacterium]
MLRRWAIWLCVVGVLAIGLRSLKAEDPVELPPFTRIQGLIDQHFREYSQLRAGDIITQNEVRFLFTKLSATGWVVEDRDEIMKRVLPSGAPLIRVLRSPHGTKFMRQVASDQLIYDRLERISQEPSGQRLLTDLVKLPDAARYAKRKTQPGVPDLIDFLPKDRSGKTRRVKDYDKATENIYTINDFNKAIRRSYYAATAKLRAALAIEPITSP